jgi:hypothetical protein
MLTKRLLSLEKPAAESADTFREYGTWTAIERSLGFCRSDVKGTYSNGATKARRDHYSCGITRFRRRESKQFYTFTFLARKPCRQASNRNYCTAADPDTRIVTLSIEFLTNHFDYPLSTGGRKIGISITAMKG